MGSSPEQVAGRPLGVTADVYSLGVLSFELLTGVLPYTVKRNTTGAMEDAILAGDAPLASSRVADKKLARQFRGDVDAILAKAIKREPGERYQTAEVLAADVQRYLDGHAIEARPDSAWYRLRKLLVRHRLPAIAASSVLVVALVGVATTLMQGRRASDEAERTRLATAFFSELLRINSNELMPSEADAPRPTQAMLLDRGSRLIEARFEKQPAMKAELYGVIGLVYADLGLDRLANEFATQQLQILRAQNASATQIARSLMLLSEVALAAKRDNDADAYAQQAVDALSKADAMLPEALALLARAQVETGKLTEAALTLSEAKMALRSSGSNSSAGAWLLFVEGKLLENRNRFDEAHPVYQEAIAQAHKAEGPASGAAIEIQIALAKELMFRQRIVDGQLLGDAAIATLQKLGGLQRIRAARAKAMLQFYKFGTGFADYAQTIAVLDEVSGFLKSQSSAIPIDVLAEIDFRRGWVHLRYGEYALAEPLIQSSAQVLLESTQSLFDKLWVTAALGVLKMHLGDHGAAELLLREARNIRSRMGQADSPFAVTDWMWIAINLSMQGRHLQAEELLAAAPSIRDEPGDKTNSHEMFIPETLARVRLDAGDLRGAQQALESNPNPNWNRPPREDTWAYFGHYELEGELMCELGQPSAGLAHLLRVENILDRHASPNSPVLARLRAVISLCALSLGNRKQAEYFAEQARRAFVAQPRVSPYYKEPLKRLEQKLGTKAI